VQTSEAIYAHLPVGAQNLACSYAGFRRARARYTPHFHARLAEWEASGRGSLAGLHAIQRERLRALLTRARAHVPHYRDVPPLVDHPDPLRSLADTLARIPVLEKQTYRERPESFLAADVPPSRRLRGKTSGTTGTALPLWYTPETLAEEYATVWRQRRSFGVGLSDPNLTFNGQTIVPFAQARPPYWRHNRWGRQTLFSLYHMREEFLADYVTAIHATRARYATGYPSSLHLVARAMLRAERPLPPGRLAGIFTSSESLLAFQRREIEAAFGAPVRDRYGVSEFCVSMTACRLDRLHVDMEFGIVEVEPEEETEDYVRGPLLATGLATEAAPLIRYRIGDVGTRSKRPCECGRPGDVFLDVDGRIEDYVVTPDGRMVGRLDHIFKEQLAVAEAQILQDDRDAIDVLIVARPEYDAASERGLEKEIRSRLGDRIAIRIRRVDSIPREANGKFRAVKSRVGALS
jgi:phenylacetate-CoA ligase